MNPSDTSDYDDSYTEWFDSYSGSECKYSNLCFA
jgi:hypothetical protein